MKSTVIMVNKNNKGVFQASDAMKKINWVVLFGIVIISGCITTVQESGDVNNDIIGVVGEDGPKQCSTVECFVVAANECEETFLDLDEDIGAVAYYSIYDPYLDICTLDKKIVKVADNENPVVKKMLEGKNLVCTYQKGEFNERWVTSLIYDIENCQGELKESIGQLMVFSS